MWLVESHDRQRRRASVGCEFLTSCPGPQPSSMTRISCRAPVWHPVLALAARCGLHALVADRVHIGAPGGVNAFVKVPALVAGMVAGADCIDDMDLLRHGGMGRVFADARAPSTLGTFLRAFTFGHVRQLDAVASRLLVNLAAHGVAARHGSDRVRRC
jgi:hypothetical protein